MISESVIEFLKESNNIEDEWDDTSLAQALYAWDYISEQDKLTPGVVLKTHKILMLHHNLRPDEKGYFRKRPVWIGGSEGKKALAIPELVENWCKQANETVIRNPDECEGGNKEYDINQDHVAYEAIHPFIDGNGRTGRIFLNWQRIKAGLPILVIKEKEKYLYYEWFK